jgi:hypothetical protein
MPDWEDERELRSKLKALVFQTVPSTRGNEGWPCIFGYEVCSIHNASFWGGVAISVRAIPDS